MNIAAISTATRAIRPITVETVIKVRNVQAESFDDAKDRAATWVPESHRDGLSAFAQRECDGSYTVEFR